MEFVRTLTVSIFAILTPLVAPPAAAAELKVPSTAGQAPRKVIVGTAMQAFWGEYPGLAKRLVQLGGVVDQMGGESQKKNGPGAEPAGLAGVGVAGEAFGDVRGHLLPFNGP